jgi:hypothetical protein
MPAPVIIVTGLSRGISHAIVKEVQSRCLTETSPQGIRTGRETEGRNHDNCNENAI